MVNCFRSSKPAWMRLASPLTALGEYIHCPRIVIRFLISHITACSSVVRQHASALLNAMNADFERATGTWEIEWLVLPEIFCYTAGALSQAKLMLSGLVVHPENMMKDLRLTKELVNTEAVMMALGPKIGRGKAHDKISRICIAVSQGKGKLIDLLSAEPDITNIFDRKALEELLDPTKYLGNSGAMVDHVLSLAQN